MFKGAIFRSLKQRAELAPDAVALIQNDKTVSFQELSDAAKLSLEMLSFKGLENRATVAIEADKCPETIALAAALDHLQHSVLLMPANVGADAKSLIYHAASVAAEIRLNQNEFLVTKFSVERAPSVSATLANTPSLLLTTSGSTGIPKGVRLSHDGLKAFFAWAQAYFDMRPGKKVLSFAPLNFDLSLLEVWAALDCGASVILADASQAADAHAMRALLQTHRAQIIQGVPLLFRHLVEEAQACYPFVTDLIVTGEATPKQLRQRIASAFPNAMFHNIYGATETNDSFILSSDADYFTSVDVLPIGDPIASTKYKIVDDDGEAIQTAGIGELHTSTPFSALGYTDPTLTAEKFYIEDDGTFYRTGDLVERDTGGAIRILGRRDHVVKVKGVRTNLRDVELALEKHPAVTNAVACPLEDDAGNTILHAVVQIRSDVNVSSLVLRKHCVAKLPRSAIPNRFTVSNRPLPLTSTGKPDRKAIKNILEKDRNYENA